MAENIAPGNRPNSHAQAIDVLNALRARRRDRIGTAAGGLPAALTRKKLIVLVLDNDGFAVINKLQSSTGGQKFSNLIVDCPTVPEPFAIDFGAHAAAMGAAAEAVSSLAELGEAFRRAKASNRTSLIVMKVDPHEGWTVQDHAWWEIGTPEASKSETVRVACEDWESGRSRQRVGV